MSEEGLGMTGEGEIVSVKGYRILICIELCSTVFY